MKDQIAKQIHDHLTRTAKRIFVIPHQHPDGDALGAATAMWHYLAGVEKDVHLFCATEAPPHLQFLPESGMLETDPAIWDTPPDTIIDLDSGDLRYAGVASYIEKLNPKPVIVNIDHHATNEFYGTHNLVITTAASTTEILTRYFLANNVTIDAEMATSLLTGLITDTDSFTNAATSSDAMALAAKLVQAGAKLPMITQYIYKQRSLESLRLWADIFTRLTIDEKSNVVYTYMTQDDINKYALSDEDADGIANFLNMISEGSAGMILKEKADGTVKGSFRTTHDDLDVSAWAKKLNGGGHKKAAGFSVPGPMDKALAQVLAVLHEGK